MQNVLALQMLPASGALDPCISWLSCESHNSCKSDLSVIQTQFD